MKSSKFNENLANLKLQLFFGVGVLGPPVWEPGPKILRGFVDAPKTVHPAPCHHFRGAGGDALKKSHWFLHYLEGKFVGLLSFHA
jgi:hypothetical protein